ncbi:MAG: hypothetical protein OEW44_03105 [Gemmatimonadota bacterium]|jgi:hypothetical protein|nr:hypothetical protein [Gemmatimonadota bacterium]
MRALWYFVHMAGQVAWLGGAMAAMAVAFAAKREQPELMGVVARLQGSIYRALVGPGALLTVVSGFMLTLQMYSMVTAVGLSHWLMAMQGIGIIAGLIALIHTVPTSAKLSRLEPTGATATAFAAIRKRLVVSGMTSSMLGMLALLTSALYQMR